MVPFTGIPKWEFPIFDHHGHFSRLHLLARQVLCAVRAPAMALAGAASGASSSGPSGCMADGRAARAAVAWRVPEGRVPERPGSTGASFMVGRSIVFCVFVFPLFVYRLKKSKKKCFSRSVEMDGLLN